MSYSQAVRSVLIPRSRRGASTISAATKEWERSPNRSRKKSDHCQLCGHVGFTYSQLIRHKLTGEELLIGTQCAANFWPLPVPPGQPRGLGSALRRA